MLHVIIMLIVGKGYELEIKESNDHKEIVATIYNKKVIPAIGLSGRIKPGEMGSLGDMLEDLHNKMDNYVPPIRRG